MFRIKCRRILSIAFSFICEIKMKVIIKLLDKSVSCSESLTIDDVDAVSETWKYAPHRDVLVYV